MHNIITLDNSLNLFAIIGALIVCLIGLFTVRLNTIEKDLSELKEYEKKNAIFRHNFDSVTKGIMECIKSEIEHLNEQMNLKFDNIKQMIQNKKNEANYH